MFVGASSIGRVVQLLTLPHVGFNRTVGEFAGGYVSPAGDVLTRESWESRREKWLPSQADLDFVGGLMRPVREPGRIAGWLAPPASGIHGKQFDFEYVRL